MILCVSLYCKNLQRKDYVANNGPKKSKAVSSSRARLASSSRLPSRFFSLLPSFTMSSVSLTCSTSHPLEDIVTEIRSRFLCSDQPTSSSSTLPLGDPPPNLRRIRRFHPRRPWKSLAGRLGSHYTSPVRKKRGRDHLSQGFGTVVLRESRARRGRLLFSSLSFCSFLFSRPLFYWY